MGFGVAEEAVITRFTDATISRRAVRVKPKDEKCLTTDEESEIRRHDVDVALVRLEPIPHGKELHVFGFNRSPIGQS